MPEANPRLLRPIPPNAGLTAETRRRLLALMSAMTADVAAVIRRLHRPGEPLSEREIEAALEGVQNRRRAEWEHLLATLPVWLARSLRASARNAIRQELARKGITKVALKASPGWKERDQEEGRRPQPLIGRILAAYWGYVLSAWLLGSQKGKDAQAIIRDVGKYGKRAKDALKAAAGFMASRINSEVVGDMMTAAGFTVAVWEHHPGIKGGVRPTHVQMDGQTCLASRGLYDSAVGRYVKPRELLWCRCEYRYLIPESVAGSGVDLAHIARITAQEKAEREILEKAKARAEAKAAAKAQAKAGGKE